MMNEILAINILKRAKELLVTKGWTQGVLAEKDDRLISDTAKCTVDCDCFCVTGALQAATKALFEVKIIKYNSHESNVYYEALMNLENTLGCDYNYFGSIPQWNDLGSRTKEEVIELLDATIGEV